MLQALTIANYSLRSKLLVNTGTVEIEKDKVYHPNATYKWFNDM